MADSEGFPLILTCAEHPGIRESGRFLIRVHFTTADTALTLDAPRDAFAATATRHPMRGDQHGVPLGQGPIIEQEVIRVDRTLPPGNPVAAGRGPEALAPAHAVRWHAEHRVPLDGARTVLLR